MRDPPFLPSCPTSRLHLSNHHTGLDSEPRASPWQAGLCHEAQNKATPACPALLPPCNTASLSATPRVPMLSQCTPQLVPAPLLNSGDAPCCCPGFPVQLRAAFSAAQVGPVSSRSSQSHKAMGRALPMSSGSCPASPSSTRSHHLTPMVSFTINGRGKPPLLLDWEGPLSKPWRPGLASVPGLLLSI